MNIFPVKEFGRCNFIQAKQRASIKWLLSKAYNHKTPLELTDPFYKSNDETEHLKPHLVHALANAELYCMALSNLYKDPNYHKLNHWGIIQALARKGVTVVEPTDCALTETVLIQTTPLRMSAHMAVTEALMHLFVKEIVAIERVVEAVSRLNRRIASFSLPSSEKNSALSSTEFPSAKEEALLFWVNKCIEALFAKISHENNENHKCSTTPSVLNVEDLRDGMGLCAVISVYCPDRLPCLDIATNLPISMAESVKNVQNLQKFCLYALDYNVCHLSVEDIVYMHDSIHLNIMALLADIFVCLEVKQPPIAVLESTPNSTIHVPDPDLCSNSKCQIISKNRSLSPAEGVKTTVAKSQNNETFPVQRGRPLPTLSNTANLPKCSNSKENLIQDVFENGDHVDASQDIFEKMRNIPVAGRPSALSDKRSGSRRSRRNSVDDNYSQLSLENMGGSFENMNICDRNPDKNLQTHSDRKIQGGNWNGNGREIVHETEEEKVNFSDLRRQKARDQFHTSGINIMYNSDISHNLNKETPKRNNGFQETLKNDADQSERLYIFNKPVNGQNSDNVSNQINSVRLKLEERRRHIEDEKRRMDKDLIKRRSQLGQEAFRRAVAQNHEGGTECVTSDSSTKSPISHDENRYSRSLNVMDENLLELQTDIANLALQQNQIQQMIMSQNKSVEHQPIYISPQRRTWGAPPQNINFAHQNIPPHNHISQEGWSTPYSRVTTPRSQWATTIGQHSPGTYVFNDHLPQNYASPETYSPMLDQWGRPLPMMPYAGGMSQPLIDYPNGGPMYVVRGDPGHYRSPYEITPPNVVNNQSFRLHSIVDRKPTSQVSSPVQVSENCDKRPLVSLNSQSRSSISPQNNRTLHTSVPTPEADLMEPQNVSFINSSNADSKETKIADPPINDRLAKHLASLHISSGSQTYRVHGSGGGRSSSEKETSPPPSRPSISAAFKQNRRNLDSSSDHDMTVTTEISMSKVKMERLSDHADASRGFVISFDDETPTRAKPQLRQRKKHSLTNQIDHTGDGSKENTKPNVNQDEDSQLLICIDMNDSNVRPSSTIKNSFDSHLSSGSDSRMPVPRFNVDPSVPLEPMIPLRKTLQSEEDDGDSENSKITGMVIGDEIVYIDPEVQDVMARKKERIMMQSLKRKQQSEAVRSLKEEEARIRRDEMEAKEEMKLQKRQEVLTRRESILEQFRLKKERDKAEKDGGRMPEPVSARAVPRLRTKMEGNRGSSSKPRPKTIHSESEYVSDPHAAGQFSGSHRNGIKRGSTTNLSGKGLNRSDSRSSVYDSSIGKSRLNISGSSHRLAVGSPRFSEQDNFADGGQRRYAQNNCGDDYNRLSRSASQPRRLHQSVKRDSSLSSTNRAKLAADAGRFSGGGRLRGSRESLSFRRGSNTSLYEDDYYGDNGSTRDLSFAARRKSTSTSHLGPGSFLGGFRRRGDYDDGASDISSTTSGFSAYGYRSGTRLYREPATKSNRGIILNSIEHVVFPGLVNRETRDRILDIIDRCDCSHFLLLFRDLKCQFRAIYAYYPDTEEVYKVYGTGPKVIQDNMFESFFKYNSGGKKFTKIHTKHLTVTIDAFTIHNSLWLGKKSKLPDKKEMALVI